MNDNLLKSKIREYKEYSRMIEELEDLKTSIADDLKSYMTELKQEKLIIGEYKITYADTVRKDLNKKALAEAHEDIYNKYLTETSYKRFQVS